MSVLNRRRLLAGLGGVAAAGAGSLMTGTAVAAPEQPVGTTDLHPPDPVTIGPDDRR